MWNGSGCPHLRSRVSVKSSVECWVRVTAFVTSRGEGDEVWVKLAWGKGCGVRGGLQRGKTCTTSAFMCIGYYFTIIILTVPIKYVL